MDIPDIRLNEISAFRIFLEEFTKRGFKIEILRRPERIGFKASALQLALEHTQEEYIAIFDADFIPPPNFLTETITHFHNNEKLGIIQCRWSHINEDYNLITKAVSLGIDIHFLIEQPGRYASHCFLNFNGSAGLIRRNSIIEAGGWQSDTLAEDLDLSYRLQMAGYKVIFLRDIQSAGEVPPTIPCFKRQQARWASGSLQTAKKILPRMLNDKKIGIKQKLEGFMHLTYYFVHPLMFLSFLLASSAALFRIDVISIRIPEIISSGTGGINAIGQNITWIVFGGAIIFCTAAVWIYSMASLRLQGKSIIGNIPSLIFLGFIGYGICVSNTIEALKVLFSNKVGNFNKTPKYALRSKIDKWRNKKYQIPLDKTVILESSAFTLGTIAMIASYLNANFGILPILGIYTISYFLVITLSITQARKEI